MGRTRDGEGGVWREESCEWEIHICVHHKYLNLVDFISKGKKAETFFCLLFNFHIASIFCH